MHCQACGAKNAEDARFCNMCGAKIASVGEAGGPRPEGSSGGGGLTTRPDGAPVTGGGTTTGSGTAYGGGSGNTLSNQTLAGIGIQSSRRTYGMLVAAAVAFAGFGALLMWLMMHGSGEEVATAEGGEAPLFDPATGEPLVPGGLEPPDDESYLEGTRVVRRASGSGGSSSGAASGSSGGSSSGAASGGSGGSSSGAASGGSSSGAAAGGSSGSSGAASGSSSSSGSSSGSSGGRTSGGGATATGGGSGSGAPAGSGSSSGASSSGSGSSSGAASGSSGSSSGAPPPDWERMEGTMGDEPPDRELELYLSNVRRFIRTHYARQAQSCFTHATALSGAGVSGRVVIAFTIRPDGHTENVRVARNDTGIDTLGTCVANRVDSWQLPAPPGGASLDLEMPFSG